MPPSLTRLVEEAEDLRGKVSTHKAQLGALVHQKSTLNEANRKLNQQVQTLKEEKAHAIAALAQALKTVTAERDQMPSRQHTLTLENVVASQKRTIDILRKKLRESALDQGAKPAPEDTTTPTAYHDRRINSTSCSPLIHTSSTIPHTIQPDSRQTDGKPNSPRFDTNDDSVRCRFKFEDEESTQGPGNEHTLEANMRQRPEPFNAEIPDGNIAEPVLQNELEASAPSSSIPSPRNGRSIHGTTESKLNRSRSWADPRDNVESNARFMKDQVRTLNDRLSITILHHNSERASMTTQLELARKRVAAAESRLDELRKEVETRDAKLEESLNRIELLKRASIVPVAEIDVAAENSPNHVTIDLRDQLPELHHADSALIIPYVSKSVGLFWGLFRVPGKVLNWARNRPARRASRDKFAPGSLDKRPLTLV